MAWSREDLAEISGAVQVKKMMMTDSVKVKSRIDKRIGFSTGRRDRLCLITNRTTNANALRNVL
jgi:hypothetical protein